MSGTGLGTVPPQTRDVPPDMPIWLDDVRCNGREANLLDCNHLGLGGHNCGHSEDVILACLHLLTLY